MIIYSHTTTSRLHYVVDFMSNYYEEIFLLTSNQQKYLSSPEAKINYSHEPLVDGELYIHPHSLLFETGKRHVITECFLQNGYKAFFKTKSDFGFDIFASIFYLLTRYEEYLPHEKDEYGRYDHKNSLAYKEDFLHQPLINVWLEDFKKLLAEKDASFSKVKHQFAFVPTYDIDIAWSYLNKGRKRNFGGFARDLFQGKLWYIKKRLRVLGGKEQDPFDTYKWMDEWHDRYKLNPIYFFPVAKKTSKYDKNISPQNSNYKSLIKQIAGKYKTGLHPSWQSGDIPSLLTEELNTLSDIIETKVANSRQHFIRFTLPQTFRRLITLDITDDYSMGYGSINGFRASIASPFYWYDLEKEEITSLQLHPFCFMDANSFFEQKFTPQQALEEIKTYYKRVKEINGTFISIWHNPFFGTDKLFAGWREVYEQVLLSIYDDKSSF